MKQCDAGRGATLQQKIPTVQLFHHRLLSMRLSYKPRRR
jgi:hypothetical protein